jgi:uncharacterized membrane protein (UPF0127 family)
LIHPPFGRRALIAAGLFLATAVGACAADQPPAAAAQAPDCASGKAGQAELRPLQPLTLVTARGRFPFQVELADNDRTREIGLMCRTHLAADRGMLFDFLQPTDDVSFWMRNTLIPLDIVFIGPDGRVVSIAADARPLDETPLPAGGVIRGVLELAGGRAAQIGLKPGDQVLARIFPQ